MQKRTDFATNLLTGPYRDSPLGRIVSALQDSPEQGAIHVADFAPYRPAFAAPVAFWAMTIYNGPHIVGILAIQLPIVAVDNMMTGERNWEADGLGETGETYLVGPDLYMRSAARALLEDPEAYEAALKRAQVPQRIVAAVQAFKSTVLVQKVDTAAVQAALSGDKGIVRGRNYLGTPVLSAYAPVPLEGLNWGIITEITVEEASRPIASLRQRLIFVTVLTAVVVSLAAILLSYLIMRPVAVLTEGAEHLAAGNADTHIVLNSRDEFGRLANRLNTAVEHLRTQTTLGEKKSRESDILLQSLVPQAVAEQLRRGDDQIVNHVQQASLLVAQWDGVIALSERMEPEAVARVLDEWVSAFDRAAERLDMEMLRTSGERFMAVCGLTVPHLDHAKRTVDFSLELLEAMQLINDRHGTQLCLRMGVHSGPITASPLGDKMMYSLWGEAVPIAIGLSMKASLNEILVSEPIYRVLHDFHACLDYGTVKIEAVEQVISIWVLANSLKMPQDQVRLVQSTFGQLLPVVDHTAERFYQRLFDLDPKLRPLFKDDIKEQQRKLMSALQAFISDLNDPEKMIPAAQLLGRSHKAYGVADEHYHTVGTALLWTLEQELGADFTPEAWQAWEAVYRRTSQVMRSAMALTADVQASS